MVNKMTRNEDEYLNNDDLFVDFELEESVKTQKKEKKNGLSPDSAPPPFNYDKKIKEIHGYMFEINEGSDISDIIVYIEKLQKNRSRLIQMEQEAERNYTSLDLTYDILYSTEYLQRTEKTQKEKEAATLVKLQSWAEAASSAKIYLSACKRFREQIDSTHHMLTKILNAKELEVRLRAYEGRSPDSNSGKSDYTKPLQELDWTD